MPTKEEFDRFVAAFADHWREADGGFRQLMHPGATLEVPGAQTPLSFEEADRFVTAVKAAIPDMSLRVLDWAARGPSVYIEWEMSGTIAGRYVTWRGINRNILDGPKSRAGVSYWDRHALLEQVEPHRPQLDLGAELARLQSGVRP